MTCPAPTATRPPATASQPTRSGIVTTTPRSVRQTRTPKFVKLHNGNMHKHTPESLCILPIDETGCAGRRSPIFVCLPYCDFSFIRRPYCDFPPIPKIPFLYLSSAYTCPVFTVSNRSIPAPVFKPIPLISASRSHIVSNPRFVANEQKSNPR